MLKLRLRLLNMLQRWFGSQSCGGARGVSGGDTRDVDGVAVLVGELNRFPELVGQLDGVAVLVAYIRHELGINSEMRDSVFRFMRI